MSLTGDEKLIDAHKTQHKLPIHNGLLPSNKTDPPLAELLTRSQTDLFSKVTGELETKTVLEDADQLHDLNVHWLELEMVAGEEVM